jgi:PPM family protein phosphatase
LEQVQLQHGGRTDVGRVREVNEDAFLAAPPVFVVADGLGGHDGGDVASGIVVEEFGRLSETLDASRGTEQVERTLATCQQRIAEFGRRRVASGEARGYAATTVVAAVLVDDDEPEWLLVNLGDSRIYHFGGDRLDQVSVDHSLVQELVDAGRLRPEDAAVHPERHVITRALGGPNPGKADYFRLPLASAGRLLLCSDGISGMIDDAAIAGILRRAATPAEAADQLVDAALAAGGQDNATAVVVDVAGAPDEPGRPGS